MGLARRSDGLSVAVDEVTLQDLFDRFGVQDLGLRAEVREFSKYDTQSQMVYLFLEARTRRNPVRGHVMNAVYATALTVGSMLAGLLGYIAPRPPEGP